MHRYKVFLFFSLAGLSAGLLTGLPSTAQETHAPLPQAKDSFIVIAHRGNHVDVPENTVAAVEEAVKSGANYAEIDLRTTKDGFLVLSHDATVDRMTDGKGNVKDLTLEEIKKLKIVGHAGPDNHKVYHIPEFKDVLAVCGKRINIYLDFKDADPVETYRQLKAAGMEKQVVVYLNKPAHYKQWKQAAPQMPLMASLPDGINTPEAFALFLGQVQIEVLDNVHDSAMLAVARQHGVAVWLDVEGPGEDAALWEQTLRKDIQGVQTDHPQALVAWLKQTNQRNGAAAFRGSHPSPQGYTLPAYRKLSDVAYGSDANNVLDAYIPSDYEQAKVIVYIHGGGWTGGDKGEFPAPLIEELVGRRKYILVSMNYRLIKDGKNIFPAQMEDVSGVLAFLTKYSKKYHYDGSEFALMGGSAGAYMAMLYAYGYDTARQVKTVIDYWGPTDLSDKAVRAENKDADSKVVTLLGVADPRSQVCLDASPYYRVTKTTGVPTILFHGGEDPLVNISQADKMYKKLLELGIPAQYETYPHEKHGMGPVASVDVFKKTLTWLDKYYPAK